MAESGAARERTRKAKKKQAGEERIEIWIKSAIKEIFKIKVKELIAEIEKYKG